MTEFEIIKNALARVKTDMEIYDSSGLKSIHIPVYTLLGDDIELEFEFDEEGKLTNTLVWDQKRVDKIFNLWYNIYTVKERN